MSRIQIGKQGNGQTHPQEWSWRTRARAWIFGTADTELILGTFLTGITDGESYLCPRLFDAGQQIPEGENEKVRQLSNAAAEFHLCQEMTIDDLLQSVAAKRHAATPGHAFWIEPKTDGKSAWRVCYAARKGASVVDLLCLRDRLARPGKARLMVAIKSWRMKVMNEELKNA